jgi:exodeoxyribonuclease III
VRIATWNVNSIRTRKGVVIDALHSFDIDVVAMQETKCRDDQFPYEDFENAGYEVSHHGLNQWNGVAFASRFPLEDIEIGFSGMPGFTKNPAEEEAVEARALSVTVEGIRLCSVYVPNGRSLDDPHFDYKLLWLQRLAHSFGAYRKSPGAMPFAILGDFNIAPTQGDVGDPQFLQPGTTHTSPLEREALTQFLHTTNTRDVVRDLVPEGYTFWDYKEGKFAKNHGLRIDFIFGSPEFSDLVAGAEILRQTRAVEGPSDHVPVVVELIGESEDDRPMVF